MININGLEIPDTHFADAFKLEAASGYVDLFKLVLNDGVTTLHLKLNNDGTWQGNDYEGTGIKLDGVSKYADDQTSRPSLIIFNPNGIFSYLVNQGVLEGATVTRYRVIRSDFEGDINVFRSQRWVVRRVASLKVGMLTLELRDLMDGQQFLVPGRMFMPPDFPSVGISG